MIGQPIDRAEKASARSSPVQEEDRMRPRARLNTYENRLLVVLSLGGAVAALDAQALFYLSPFVAKDLHLNNTQIGVLSAAVLLTWSIAAYAIGVISDRNGKRKPYLVLGFALFAVFSSLSGLAINFLTLLGARLTVGLSEGPVIPISNAIMAANSTPSRRGLNLGVVQNFGAQLVGSLFGPLIVVALATAISWRAAFFISGIPGLLTALLIMLVVREAPREAAPRPGPALHWRALRDLIQVRNVGLSAAIACCLIGWYILLLTFLPLYCVNGLHMSATLMSVVLASVGAAGAISAIVVPALSDRFGRKPILILLGLSGSIAPASALLLAPGPAMILMIFVGSFALGVFPLFMGVVPQESVPAPQGAQSTALVMAVGQIIGGFVGPALGGMEADAYGLQAPLEMAICLAIIGGALAFFVKETAPCRMRSLTAAKHNDIVL
jgi:ACS family hexuronate transporter-like MFS transporter